jgi:hypothetical protein
MEITAHQKSLNGYFSGGNGVVASYILCLNMSFCGDDENRLTPPDLEHQGLRHTQPDNNTVSNVGLLCVANVPRVPLIEVSRFTV